MTNYRSILAEIDAMTAILKQSNDEAEQLEMRCVDSLPMPVVDDLEWDETPSPRFPDRWQDAIELDTRCRINDAREYHI